MKLDFAEVSRVLHEQSDSERSAKMSAYMRDQFSYLGIPASVRQKLTRAFLKPAQKASFIDWNFVDACWGSEREFQYLALDYLDTVMPLLTPDDIPRLRELALSKSWWDTIDHIDAIIGNLALTYPELNEVLLAWSTDENFWLRRIAIDHQLGRRDKTDAAFLEQIIINNFGQTEFFITKAIGWALREYSKTDPVWVKDFIDRYREQLAPLSLREASKYI